MKQILFATVVFAWVLVPVRAQDRKPADPLDGPPFVTCRGWAIADGKSGEVLWGHEVDTARPIASTSKIMTAWIVLRLARENEKILDERVTISERSDKTGGSTAKVETGEVLPVRDLLYGLMLPSGNDAAVALAEHFGDRFPTVDGNGDALARFVAEMNRTAAQLKMTKAKYLNPHGMGANSASPRDLIRLAWTAMQEPRFRDYVQTREHRCKAVRADGTTRDIVWTNTNQLLGIEGYDGIKTGTTSAAGACLVSSGRRGDDHLLMVVLGSTSPDARYVDSRNLYRWAWKQRGHKK